MIVRILDRVLKLNPQVTTPWLGGGVFGIAFVRRQRDARRDDLGHLRRRSRDWQRASLLLVSVVLSAMIRFEFGFNCVFDLDRVREARLTRRLHEMIFRLHRVDENQARVIALGFLQSLERRSMAYLDIADFRFFGFRSSVMCKSLRPLDNKRSILQPVPRPITIQLHTEATQPVIHQIPF